jgi:WD40 repeat protein
LDTVSALEFHQEFLYSGSYDSSVKTWNSTTGSINREYVKHTDRVTTIQIGPKFLYFGSMDATVRVWDKETAIAIDINCKFYLVSNP